MKKGLLLLPLATLSFASDYEIHILKEGETLSELLLSRGYSPLYGPDQWVEKALKMNHLQKNQAAQIKKGLPIILPKKAEVAEVNEEVKELEKDFVTTKNAAVIRTGIFGNTISDHQKVFLELDYFSNSINLPKDTLTLNENYGLGIRVDGENDFSLGAMTYNVNGSFFVYTHGSSQFEDINNVSASFDPTYMLESHLEIQAPQVEFNFGPSLLLEERSRLTQSDAGDVINIRRDRTAWIGFQANKIMEVNHLRYEATLGLRRKVLQQTLNDTDDFNATNLYFNTKVNLSANYDFTLKFGSTQYNNIGIDSEEMIGANFSYNLK